MSPVETIIETVSSDGDRHQKILHHHLQHTQIGRKSSGDHSDGNEPFIIRRKRLTTYDDDNENSEEFDSSASLSSIATTTTTNSVKSGSDFANEDDGKCRKGGGETPSNEGDYTTDLGSSVEENSKTLTSGRSNNAKYRYCSTKSNNNYNQKTIHRSLLFGVQLEVTSLLLEAERRKLNVLQHELKLTIETDGTVRKSKEIAKQELILAITRIQSQYNHLEKEYHQHAREILRNSKIRALGKSNRSQPAIGLKQTPKARPTIFGTVASDQCPKDNSSRRSLPQVSSGAASGTKLSASDAAILDGSESHPKHSNRQKDGPELLDDNALVYRDGNLISGSLDALIQHMVPTNTYYPDRAYLFAFLLSARLFIKPHALLAQICDLCHQQQQLHSISQEAPHLQRFTTHFVQLLAEWIDTFPYDFRDERVMKHVRSVTQKCIQITPGLRKEVSTLLQNLLQRLQALERYEEFLEKINAYDTEFLPNVGGGGGSSSSIISGPQHSSSATTISHSMSTNSSNNSHSYLHSNPNHPSVTISATLATPDITDLCPSSQSLAYQLTHIELERLSYIGPEEFVQAFAKENPSLENTFKDMKKTRNLESYVQWFNRLSYFVATEIVKHSKKKQRVRVVEYWIETARESFNIGNFNSLMAIIAGLNMSPISRLKKTWAKIQSAKFSILEHQMDPSSNFSSYRSTLKAAMWRSAGATDERERIVIPFFSLLVKDLYFLNEGCSNKLPNGHINFEKFWQLAKQVTEFIAWKQVSCPYDRNDKIIMFLQTNSILNETTLAWASFECEQPMNHERDRYKSLKQEAQLMNSSTSLGGGSSCG